jgi:uncharacterized lipoprotein YddW (UPF0748 family)
MKRTSGVLLNYFICLVLLISILCFSFLPRVLSATSRPPASLPTSTELRGVWLTNVSSGVFFVPWGVNRAIQKLSRLNFNTLYPVIWNRGHTFYPSRVAQRVTGKFASPFLTIARGGSDVLAEIVREAHKRDLSVIPWFEYGFMIPADSTIARKHPDWLTRNRAGTTLLLENKADEDFLDKSSHSNKSSFTARWVRSTRQKPSIQQVWLNPFHPAVQQFLLDLIVEAVMNYEVDGIQLDDHFGMPVELGYDFYTVKLYQKEHKGKKPPSNPRDPEWMRWRAAKITAFTSKIVRAVKTVRASAKISLSPNSHYFSYQNYLQDWKTWVEKGLVDELVLQVYRDDLKSFQAELSQSAVEVARRQIPVSIGILTGTWNRPVDVKQIQQQIQVVRDRGFSGVSFFYWETLWGYLTPDSPRQRRQAFRSLFARPAKRPQIAQKPSNEPSIYETARQLPFSLENSESGIHNL